MYTNKEATLRELGITSEEKQKLTFFLRSRRPCTPNAKERTIPGAAFISYFFVANLDFDNNRDELKKHTISCINALTEKESLHKVILQKIVSHLRWYK